MSLHPFLLLVLCTVYASATWVTYPSSPSTSEWKIGSRAPPSSLKKLIFAIKHSNVSILESELNEISNPSSPRYAQYYSLETLGNLIANPKGTLQVLTYLLNHSITSVSTSPNGEFVTVTLPIHQAETLLNTQFYHFSHVQNTSRVIYRANKYALPQTLASYVDFIGLVQLQNTISPRYRPYIRAFDPRFPGTTTPDLLNTYYSIPSNKVKSDKSTQSLFESLDQNYSPDDLQLFERVFNLPHLTINRIIGPNYNESCERNPASCGEANLDVQYMMAISQNAPTTFWNMEGDQEPFLQWAIDVCSSSSPPLVHSVSYGGYEQQPHLMHRFNQEMMKLGLRGITVVIASGDDGVGNFLARQRKDQCGFHASFPATCPYVLSVGATQGPEQQQQEIACTSSTGGLITTGGGFSSVFTQPEYQKKAIEEFFNVSKKEEIPPVSLFNTTGRAIPDVAALGHNYVIVDDHQLLVESGTSASAPVVAALIALINGELLSQNKPPLGFVNPLLYKLKETHPEVFNDITKGRNNCAAGQPGLQVCCDYGFTAVEGWDPLTGLGSIDYSKFLQAIQATVSIEEEVHETARQIEQEMQIIQEQIVQLVAE